MPRLLILFLALSLPALPGAYAADPAKSGAGQAKAKAATKSKQKVAPAATTKKKPRKKGPGVTGRLVRPDPIKIGPKGHLGPDTGFALTRIKDGHLSLAFTSRDPNLALNPKTGLVAQIYSDEEIEVEPSILTATNWPKSSDKVLLKYSVRNAKKGEKYEVEGEIAYTVCHKKTNVCEPRKSTLYLTITP